VFRRSTSGVWTRTCQPVPSAPSDQLADPDADLSDGEELVAVLLRVVDGQWPLPPNYQLAPQPLAALDLLEYPSAATRHLGREILSELKTIAPATVARRTARARSVAALRLRNLLGDGISRGCHCRSRAILARTRPRRRRTRWRAVGHEQPGCDGQRAARGDRHHPRRLLTTVPLDQLSSSDRKQAAACCHARCWRTTSAPRCWGLGGCHRRLWLYPLV
jgi:hypothetical protein